MSFKLDNIRELKSRDVVEHMCLMDARSKNDPACSECPELLEDRGAYIPQNYIYEDRYGLSRLVAGVIGWLFVALFAGSVMLMLTEWVMWTLRRWGFI